MLPTRRLRAWLDAAQRLKAGPWRPCPLTAEQTLHTISPRRNTVAFGGRALAWPIMYYDVAPKYEVAASTSL